MTPEQITARIAALETKLNARRGMPGFEANVRAIEDEIARLKSQQPQETSNG